MAHVADVTIQSSQVASDLTDFVVGVRLSDMPAGFWSTVASGGGDIRCFKSDGTTELPRDVVSCDTTAEEGELYVKYTGTLSSSSDTVIQIHADGSSADYAVTATYGRNNTWTVYEAVFHLEEDGTGGAGSIIDSTGNGNALNPNGGVADANGFWGTSGGALTFDGSNDYCGTTTAIATGDPFTITAMFNTDAVSGTQHIASFADVSVTNSNFRFMINRAGGFGGGNGTLSEGAQASGPTSSPGLATANTANTFTANTWNHGAGTEASNTSRRAKLNAGTVATDTVNKAPTTIDGFAIGRAHDSSPDGYFDGEIDELRIALSDLGDDWTDAESVNLRTPTTFYSAAAPSATGAQVLTNNMRAMMPLLAR